MGNCLVLEEKVIEEVKPQGKILEYEKPTDFYCYTISDSVETYRRHLLPDTPLFGGNLYNFIPLPMPLRSSRAKKKERFSVPEDEGSKQATGVVRIKLIISKQELKEILHKGGNLVENGNMVSELKNQQKVEKKDSGIGDDSTSWKPVLESIPELN